MNRPRPIVFMTGTRADFGKLKPLIQRLESDPGFRVHVFVTGMHTLARYGSTWDEVRKSGVSNIYRFINQNHDDSMDHILAKTTLGFSDYVRELGPDLIVVHGDRVEALAGAMVGSLADILVAHIEGGEVSGTIDESIRHAISKFSHVHFVSNDVAKRRLMQLGERADSIHVIGSPEVDIMTSSGLPSINEVRAYYEIDYERYGILAFHPVTTELQELRRHVQVVVDSVLRSGRNFVVIFPNNDKGTHIIFEEYARFEGVPQVKVIPSMRFEYFLSLLKHADMMVGNSSSGVREAPTLGVPSVNVGSRQRNRSRHDSIIDVEEITVENILASMERAASSSFEPVLLFGDGNSAQLFHDALSEERFWDANTQKYFVDLEH